MEARKTSIIDVRSPAEFAAGHIEGALNIPLDVIGDRISELKKLSPPIVLYCRSGNRSAMAVSILQQHGIRDAVNGGSLEQMQQPKN